MKFYRAPGWRLRVCLTGLIIALYLFIAAFVSLPKPSSSSESNKGQQQQSKKIHSANKPSSSSSSLDDLSIDQRPPLESDLDSRSMLSQARNLAAVQQQRATIKHSKATVPDSTSSIARQELPPANFDIPPKRRLAIRNTVHSGGAKAAQIEWCLPLKYKTPPGDVTALASYPGSGNTWLRYLLQQASGIHTGSVYKDFALLKNGFPAEHVMNGSVLVVKNHEFGDKSIAAKYDRAVILVRDPFASLKAEFNRRSGGHIGHASPDRYRRNGGKYWRDFVEQMGSKWAPMYLEWFNSFPEADRTVVFYDELVNNTEYTLRNVLSFLGVVVSDKTMKCVMSKKEGIFKRPRNKKEGPSFDPFTKEMKAELKAEMIGLYEKLGRTENVPALSEAEEETLKDVRIRREKAKLEKGSKKKKKAKKKVMSTLDFVESSYDDTRNNADERRNRRRNLNRSRSR